MRPQRTGPRVEFNGFGRVSPESAEQKRPTAAGQQAQKRSPTTDSAGAGRLVSEAQIAFLTRNYTDAERLCREALAKDRATAGAHEVLGDIHAIRGHTESAIKSYSYAIQYNPRSYSAQGKLDRLIGKRPLRDGRPNYKPKVGRTFIHARAKARVPGDCTCDSQHRPLCRRMRGRCCFRSKPGRAGRRGNTGGITSLSPNLMIALVLEGVIGGMLLAFYGRLWPISEEFASSAAGSASRKNSSAGHSRPVLGCLVLCFAAGLHRSGIRQEPNVRLNRSGVQSGSGACGAVYSHGRSKRSGWMAGDRGVWRKHPLFPLRCLAGILEIVCGLDQRLLDVDLRDVNGRSNAR